MALLRGGLTGRKRLSLHKPILQALEALHESQQGLIYAGLRRVKALANRRGILALSNAVPLGDAMLEDFEHHARTPSVPCGHWPPAAALDIAEAFLRANAQVGGRSWRHYLPPNRCCIASPRTSMACAKRSPWLSRRRRAARVPARSMC